MILKKIIKNELQKHGLIHGFKFTNQFQVLKDNYKTRFLIDGVIAMKGSRLIHCDMLVTDDVKIGLFNIAERCETPLYIIDHFDWFRNDISIEQKLDKCIWSTNKDINNKKIN